jgi:peptidyl-prolyl cis-trans isomerase D
MAAEIVKKVVQGATLATEAASVGAKVETATGFRRDASLSDVPSSAITAAFRTPKDGVGQTSGAGGSEWIVFRVTDITVPQVDASSDELKRLKDTLQRGLSDEQVAQYVSKIESEIGTTINQTAFAQVTGANN